MPISVKSYAKLNLFLAVRGKRADNYHTIETVFERIDLHDTVTLRLRRDNRVNLRCSDPRLPADESNLCVRSARLLQEKYAPRRGVDIGLRKRIPIGAGMGGGSSNAAAVLNGLNTLWDLRIPHDELLACGRRLGADVPFFLCGVSFALGSGRGDIIRPLIVDAGMKLWHVVIVPRIHVSTPLIYNSWDQRGGLTKRSPGGILLCLRLPNNKHSSIDKCLFNSLERITTALYPEVARCKKALMSCGVNAVLMSGSGSSVFGITRSRFEAVSVARRLVASGAPWSVFVTRTV